MLSHDSGLLRHWAQALGAVALETQAAQDLLASIAGSQAVVWIDLGWAGLPDWASPALRRVLQLQQCKVVAASSSPTDEEAMAALDAGCAAYCHAFSDAVTLQRIQEVVLSGNVWIGRSLMSRLLQTTAKASLRLQAKDQTWHQTLTAREREVAMLAANGTSNQAIATQCGITERTVKAHLSAVFDKLQLTDRLQLALRVHGIH